MRPDLRSGALAALMLFSVVGVSVASSDPWLDRVRAFEPGTSGGFGAGGMPAVVLGPPEGGGMNQGSLDVVSLGNGGRITVVFADNGVVDGDGDDFVIFENAFLSGSLIFSELAFVEVSADGRQWVEFPYDEETLEGLAGRTPVLADTANGLDPLDPASGGDRFDLADVGLEFVRFVRITDAGDQVDDPGNHVFAGTKGGFDLDAAAAVHSIQLGCISGIVSDGGLPVPDARVRLETASEHRRRRTTRADGSYRFCRLRPGLDYDVSVSKAGVGTAAGRIFLDEQQLHGRIDLFLE